ncbi:glycosyltransferase family 2 protein [Pedobacter caeni]|uniref:Glycosyltransferase involved in cell wall bisynthesis n=1 Tax=Pedobacter caeni TaxID=288992 RepID=A0A1M5D1Y6_9SPHI|nr:glycosyltransferase family 2 protein [Pedobacter caeni]SHF61043.1 Glycosyltransferase involved in cell wall bisynthesis [Pedobacter caeni]
MPDGVEQLKISIVTINYNNAGGLKETIQSVVDQTYGNIEYIIIDGGSTDGSKEIIEDHKDRIHYWVTEADEGIYNAMNKGIQAAKGEYLLFLNSGDLLIDKEIISEVVATSPTEDLIYGNLRCLNRPEGEEWYPSAELTFEVFYTSTIPHPSTFIKRELFKRVGLYNEKNAIVSDWEFFMVATCKYNCTYQYINKFISKFIDGGISSDPRNLPIAIKEREDALNRHFSYFLADYKRHALILHAFKKIEYFAKARIFVKNIFRSKKKGKLSSPLV